MTRERWEVRASDPADGRVVSYSIHPATVNGPAHARGGARRSAREYRERGLASVVVHIRTYRVEVVYAWKRRNGGLEPEWWLGKDLAGAACLVGLANRTLFTDPLGKHSRRRAKAAALAAKPSGPCVLVVVRRRVKE